MNERKSAVSDVSKLARLLHCSIENLVLDGAIFSKQFFAADNVPSRGCGALRVLELNSACSASFAPVLDHCPHLHWIIARDMVRKACVIRGCIGSLCLRIADVELRC